MEFFLIKSRLHPADDFPNPYSHIGKIPLKIETRESFTGGSAMRSRLPTELMFYLP
jgi:hypothetical protein